MLSWVEHEKSFITSDPISSSLVDVFSASLKLRSHYHAFNRLRQDCPMNKKMWQIAIAPRLFLAWPKLP